MSRSPLEYLRHILDEASYLLEVSHALDKEAFLGDATLKRAFVRSLEVIGEATKQLPDELRAAYPEIAWRALAGMRDKLIHHYFGVDYELVWDVVVGKIPTLKEQVAHILEQNGQRGCHT
ncbi:MAG: DUF86 domain-containing protein [Deinococcota bacterium]|jgi:uncharacterized protein with HEPN domain|nr:DUF86 domain-containing protein [Deinococcota bacterium]